MTHLIKFSHFGIHANAKTKTTSTAKWASRSALFKMLALYAASFFMFKNGVYLKQASVSSTLAYAIHKSEGIAFVIILLQ